CLQYNSSPYTF
nr:immunoglobulin light chain junction region [Macaca mulatta]MOW39177.1 immunoglobulin light chain junction region [Macaca mulatta]MOW39496.1 immunoglobulin light chain junction region [Macaca mulatta]MOW39607.1 immunoglobulin light chain junction region [Macaca mulatta]MOW40054.1 immunoglobulin light chain junction region [Macaca mulatta]